MSSGFECFHRNILNVFLYGLLINLIYTVCRIYIWYIRFVVYNRNILNVLLYGLLINFVYTVCCIYISYIRFAVYNNTEKRPTGYRTVLSGRFTGGIHPGMLGVSDLDPGIHGSLGSQGRRNESQNESLGVSDLDPGIHDGSLGSPAGKAE